MFFSRLVIISFSSLKSRYFNDIYFLMYILNRQTYMHRGGPLVGLTVCDQGQSLASSASTSGTVFVLRIEPNSSKMSLIGTRQLDLQVRRDISI